MKSCQTCKHGLCCSYAERASQCLGTDFDYALWEEGDPVAYRELLEVTGQRAIVIGGAGEHEARMGENIEDAYARLCDVSEQVGGLTRMMTVKHQDPGQLRVSTSEGTFDLWWERGRFHSITEVRTGRRVWPRFDKWVRKPIYV